MRQRAVIAIPWRAAPSCSSPTSPPPPWMATIQAQILNLIKRLNRELDMTTILITHDLGVVASPCDKVVVMYGLIMEDGTVEEIFYHPKHPYTMGLIDSIPRVTGGRSSGLSPFPVPRPTLIHPPKGCPFSTRCPYCMNVCMEEMPPISRGWPPDDVLAPPRGGPRQSGVCSAEGRRCGVPTDKLLELEGLTKYFISPMGLLGPQKNK